MVPRMKKVLSGLVVGLALLQGVQASQDPVKDYLERFSPLGGGPRFYSSDDLLRLDFDLDGDGIDEVFLSIARDRNGKQGNCWQAYKKFGEVFKNVGGITFSGRALFLGYVEELHTYGLVTFWSAGGGEGQILVQTLGKGEVKETKIGALERINGSDRMRGQRMFDKYVRAGQNQVFPAIQEIPVSDFAPKYGLPVEPITYAESFSLNRAPAFDESAFIDSEPAPSPVAVEAPKVAVQDAAAPVLMLPQKEADPLPQEPKQMEESGSVSRLPASVGRDIFLSVFLVGLLTAVHLWVKGRKASADR